MQQLLLLSNPRKKGGKKRRTAAQRAATARMLAANRSRRGGRKAKRSRASAPVAAAPRRRSGKRRSVSRITHASSMGRGVIGGVLGMVKTGAIAGGGAIVTDIGMGFIAQQFPTQPFANRINADGSINPMHYAVKGLLAYGIGRYGSRLTRHASTMAAGAYTVMLYDIIKSLIPAGSVPMAGVGYFNPARIVSGGVGRVGRVGAYENLQGVGNIARILPNAQATTGVLSPGASAANALRLAGNARLRENYRTA